MKHIVIISILSIFLWGCSNEIEVESLPAMNPQAFNEYWYDGKAEISRYSLSQARYGENHEGHAVLIFVTEDFLTEQQTKKEFGDDLSQKVLKLNATRNFQTGLYPYSLMTSAFTSIDHQSPLTQKISFSSQEWCGQTYMQLNRKGSKYRIKAHSYFQNEGDQDFKLSDDPLEDSLWNQLRIAPQSLPQGDVELIPSLAFLRLRHVEAKAYDAEAKLSIAEDSSISSGQVYRYTIDYEDLPRKLEIFFNKNAPHEILGWREETLSGFGDKARTLVTTARRTHTIKEAYWQKNRNADRRLLPTLGME